MMYNYRITYIDYNTDDTADYEIESACSSVGLFMVHHKWAIDFLEKNHRIVSVTLVQ
jgi:hypothetical protein